MPDITPKYAKGQTHVEFAVDLLNDDNPDNEQVLTVDPDTVSQLRIVFRRPNGTTFEKDALLRNSNKEMYHINTDGYATAMSGFWTYAAKIIYGTGEVLISHQKTPYFVVG